MNNQPLVSIGIVTYNSAKFIIELLDSIYNQTYANIELVISDDCSKDNTVALCKDWMKEHKNRFKRAVLLEAETNQGVCANLNRCVAECQGDWIKGIAGDDTLPKNSIQEYVNFINEHPNCKICFAKMKTFGEDKEANEADKRGLESMFESIKLPTKEQQYTAALRNHILPGPGLFYRKDFVDSIGGFNPEYRNEEEYDFELRAFKKEHVLFVDKYLVNWRIHRGSVSHSMTYKSLDYQVAFFQNVLKPELKERGLYLLILDKYVILKSKSLKKRGHKILGKLIMLMSPLYIVAIAKKYLKG